MTPGFYFEISSPRREDWKVEHEYYNSRPVRWFEILNEFPFRLADFSADDLQYLKQIFTGYGLSFHGATLNLSLVAAHEGIVRQTVQTLVDQLSTAEHFGCELFTFHAGEYPYFIETVDDEPGRVLARNIAPVLDRAREVGCIMCIENLKHKNVFPRTLKETASAFSACPELGLAFDVRHACIVGEDPSDFVREFSSQLKSVQYRADCGLSAQGIDRLFDTLARVSFDGPFIVEDASLNEVDKSHRPMIDEARIQLSRYLAY